MTTATQTVKERPILFSGEMVRAILEGRKTQTRRVMKIQPPEDFDIPIFDGDGFGVFADIPDENYMDNWPEDTTIACPYGKPGDRLWVKETWRADDYFPDETIYQSEFTDATIREVKGVVKWKSSRFMPRKRSQIDLEITNVRVERLQDISEDDACFEGISFEKWNDYPLTVFRDLWDKINGKKHPWASNPWVWVVGFDVLKEGM